MSRTTELLKLAADALEGGEDPLALPFLVRHSVTLDECFTLGEMLAAGGRLLAVAIEHPDIARGALNGAHVAAAYKALNAALAKWQPAQAADVPVEE